jgi:uncharacterized DUF497 family protein
MKYEWDEAKNRKNFAKHGLSFEDAGQVFSGPCVTFEDDRFAYEEERRITLGPAGRPSGCHSPFTARRGNAHHLHAKGEPA